MRIRNLRRAVRTIAERCNVNLAKLKCQGVIRGTASIYGQ
jgi:hypothetical protein